MLLVPRLPCSCGPRAHSCGLPAQPGQALAETLKQNSSLTTISLSYNAIGADGAKAAVLLRPSLASMWPACSARPGTGRGFEAEQQPHHD